MRVIVAAAIVLLVSACASIQIEVAAFHDLSPTARSLKYAVVPVAGQEASLEHKAFRDLVKTELNKRGYLETPEAEADVHVFLFYGVDSGRERVSSYPIVGQTGTQYTYIPAPLPPSGSLPTYRSGTTISAPTYGVVGTATSSETLFESYLHLDIVDRAESLKAGEVRKRYEATVVAIGPSGHVAVVVPAMISALFQDFPGTSGSARRVNLPMR
jgi:hypothetical protein